MSGLVIALNGLLFLALFCVIYFTFLHFREKKILNKALMITEKRYLNRKEISEKVFLEKGNIDDPTFFEKIDMLIERSGIRSYVSFFNTELLLLSMIIFSIVGFFVSKAIYDFWVINLGVAVLVGLICYIALYIASGITFEKVDDGLLLFINHLENFSSTTDDIVTLFEKTLPYVKEPLKRYVEEFVNEAKSGDLKLAFRNFEKKVENKRFKSILNNLEIASRHEANYKDILGESRVILKGYFESKQRNKSIVQNGRAEILLVLLMSAVMIGVMGGITPNLLFDLQNTLAGNFIILYCVIIFIFIIWQFIAFDKE